jgi:hypothetical protein
MILSSFSPCIRIVTIANSSFKFVPNQMPRKRVENIG